MCKDDDPYEAIHLKLGMQITAFIFGVIAIIEMCLGADATTQIGAGTGFGVWWAGLICLIPASLGIASASRNVVIAGLVFSIISTIIAIVGCIVLGVYRAFFLRLTSCYNTENDDFSGEKKYAAYAYACAIKAEEKCACVIEDNDKCYDIAWKENDDCGDLLDQFPHYLGVVSAFCALCVVMSFIYSVLCCVSLCHREPLASQTQGPTIQTASVAGNVPIVVSATVATTGVIEK